MARFLTSFWWKGSFLDLVLVSGSFLGSFIESVLAWGLVFGSGFGGRAEVLDLILAWRVRF